MPCNGVTVSNVEVAIDLQEHFQNRDNQLVFEHFLRQNNVMTRGWWRSRKEADMWAIAIGSVDCGLDFKGSQIRISDEGPYNRFKAEVDRAYELAQVYAGQLVQAQIYQRIQAQYPTRDEKQYDNGTFEFRFTKDGVPVRVIIANDGRSQFITEGGEFDGGVNLLQELFAGMRAGGISADVANYESHRHGHEGEHVHTHFDNLAHTHNH